MKKKMRSMGEVGDEINVIYKGKVSHCINPFYLMSKEPGIT